MYPWVLCDLRQELVDFNGLFLCFTRNLTSIHAPQLHHRVFSLESATPGQLASWQVAHLGDPTSDFFSLSEPARSHNKILAELKSTGISHIVQFSVLVKQFRLMFQVQWWSRIYSSMPKQLGLQHHQIRQVFFPLNFCSVSLLTPTTRMIKIRCDREPQNPGNQQTVSPVSPQTCFPLRKILSKLPPVLFDSNKNVFGKQWKTYSTSPKQIRHPFKASHFRYSSWSHLGPIFGR